MKRFAARRSGVSILEVLFSVLIGSIGLLGAIALLPVASEQARKGRQSDAQAIAGEAFVNEFKVRQLYNPDRWVISNGTQPGLHNNGDWYVTTSTKMTGGPSVGDSFCVDPRGFARYVAGTPTYRIFPYNGTSPAMHRVGIAKTGSDINGNTFDTVSTAVADLMACSDDDLLATKSEKDRSLPAAQTFNPAKVTELVKLHRDSENRFSWIATLTPKPDQTGDEYVLSVVVLYDRPLPAGTDPDPLAEREVSIKSFDGGGITGGEVTLETKTGQTADDLSLHNGDWIMLKGTKDSQSYFRWYKVLETEVEPQQSGSTYTRDVTLFGADWPSSLTTGSPIPTQAVLITGAVAVYEKTVRIQRTSLWQ